MQSPHTVIFRLAAPALLFAFPLLAHAQSPPPARTPPVSGYVSFHLGIAAPTSKTLVNSGVETFGINRNEARADFDLANGASWDFGGGVIVKRRFVAGAAFSRASSNDAGVFTVNMSHPASHPDLTDSVATAPLNRREGALHMHGGVLVPMGKRVEVMFFGGPSHFALTQDLVVDADVNESFNGAWFVSVANPVSEKRTGSGWGYNVGGDISVQLARGFSVGSLVRFSQGTVNIEDPLGSLVTGRTVLRDSKVGGLQVLGGVRWRF